MGLVGSDCLTDNDLILHILSFESEVESCEFRFDETYFYVNRPDTAKPKSSLLLIKLVSYEPCHFKQVRLLSKSFNQCLLDLFDEIFRHG